MAKYQVRKSLSLQFASDEMQSLRESFSKFDNDENGHIDGDELKQILKIIGQPVDDKHVQSLMKTGDTDGDGQLSFEEFVDLVHKSKLVRVAYSNFIPVAIIKSMQ